MSLVFETRPMKAKLEERDVSVEFLEMSDDQVFIAYQTNFNDTTQLVTELRTVIAIVLEHESGSAVTGLILHSNHPVIATWRLEAEWARQYRRGNMPKNALVTLVLRQTDVIPFK